jgi:hypothetical protein
MYRHTSGATSESRPFRVRLPDFTTRTGEAVTDEILAEAGWSLVAEQSEVIVEPQVEVVVDQVELVTSGS